WVVGDDSPFLGATRHTTRSTRPSGLYNAISIHWDGSSWHQVQLPPTSGSNSTLNDVVALSPTNAWAVGMDGDRTLVMHWDGTAWTRVPSPTNIYDAFNSVTAVSANDIWAAGND